MQKIVEPKHEGLERVIWLMDKRLTEEKDARVQKTKTPLAK
tara:strand:- start:64 stop:186 length:123 start_codon:yes stop_codon:yes gene_type:complete